MWQSKDTNLTSSYESMVIFVSKGLHWIDLGCTPGGNPGAQDRDGDHKYGGPDHRERIMRLDAVENTTDPADQSQDDR